MIISNRALGRRRGAAAGCVNGSARKLVAQRRDPRPRSRHRAASSSAINVRLRARLGLLRLHRRAEALAKLTPSNVRPFVLVERREAVGQRDVRQHLAHGAARRAPPRNRCFDSGISSAIAIVFSTHGSIRARRGRWLRNNMTFMCLSLQSHNHESQTCEINTIARCPPSCPPPVREALVADLRALAGDRCTTQSNPARASQPRRIVARPRRARRRRLSDEHGRRERDHEGGGASSVRPSIPFGIGSSLEGHVNALSGGVSIDFSRMTRDPARSMPSDLDATVEAGVTHRAVEQGAEQHRARLLGRSGRRCDDRRHGRDAGVRDDGGALRHDARGRPRPDGGARRRPRHSHGQPRAQVVGRATT